MSGTCEPMQLRQEDVVKFLVCQTHVGSRNVDFQMEQYVYKRKNDGKSFFWKFGVALNQFHSQSVKIHNRQIQLATSETTRMAPIINGKEKKMKGEVKRRRQVSAKKDKMDQVTALCRHILLGHNKQDPLICRECKKKIKPYNKNGRYFCQRFEADEGDQITRGPLLEAFLLQLEQGEDTLIVRLMLLGLQPCCSCIIDFEISTCLDSKCLDRPSGNPP